MFHRQIQDRCTRTGSAPLSESSREGLAPDLRMAPLERYVSFFRVLDDMVRIERVLHCAANFAVILESEESRD